MASYSEIVDLISQVEFDQGQNVVYEKVYSCQICEEDMKLVKFLTKRQFVQVVDHLVRVAKPTYFYL